MAIHYGDVAESAESAALVDRLTHWAALQDDLDELHWRVLIYSR